MPSELYWQGLLVWGIRRMPGPQSVINRVLIRRPALVARDDDGEVLDGLGVGVWHPNLPKAPAGHPDGATFVLSLGEADFLAERLRTEPRTRGSLLASLLVIATDHAAVGQVWNHPYLQAMPLAQREVVEQARRFSVVMPGAAWVYNVILAAMDERESLEEAHRASFAEWSHEFENQRETLAGWDLRELWSTLARASVVPPPRTQLFVHDWFSAVCDRDTATLLDRTDVRDLIVRRERRMKGRNARTANARALKQWGGASGTLPLDTGGPQPGR